MTNCINNKNFQRLIKLPLYFEIININDFNNYNCLSYNEDNCFYNEKYNFEKLKIG